MPRQHCLRRAAKGNVYGQEPPSLADLLEQLMVPAGGVTDAQPENGNPFSFAQSSRSPPPTDTFLIKRFPVLESLKRVILPSFFLYCFARSWIGRFGLLQGLVAKSYFDMLVVPLRVLPQSPLCGRAFVVAQSFLNMGLRAVGFLINLVRGKTSFSALVTDVSSGSSWSNVEGTMTTASTSPPVPTSVRRAPELSSPPQPTPRAVPVVDATILPKGPETPFDFLD